MPGEKKSSKGKEEKICTSLRWDDKPCGRYLYDDEHCIFHSKNIKKKKDKFINAFWKEVERQKEHEEIYDFTGFVFPEDISFEGNEFEKDVSFFMAQFSGKAYFIETKFSGEVNFFRSTFSGEELTGLFDSLRNKGIRRIAKGRYKIKDFRFHLGEKISKEYPVIDRTTKDAWYLNDFKANHPIIYWIWWLFADCGRSFKRWLA